MSRPSISIIIPTFKRPRQLAACLQSMSALNYPQERLEIIVINDGGEAAQIEAFVEKYENCRGYTQANAGPAAARNAGASLAQGQFLAFIDDDCRPDPDWLTHLAAQLVQNPDCLAGGRTVNNVPNNYAAASQLLIDYLYDYYNRETAVFFTSNNMAMSAARFQQVSGFDTTFSLAAGEDRDFCDRWRLAGQELVYVPTAVIYHQHHLTLSTFWRQHFNYGRGAYQFHQRRRQRQQAPVPMEPLSFYLNLVSYPQGRGDGRSWLLSFLLFITQLANALGFYSERLSGKKKRPPT